MGDININILDSNEKIKEYRHILSKYGLMCYNDSIPTRVDHTRNSSTLIDHMFARTKRDIRKINTYIVETNISDHYSIFISLEQNERHDVPPAEQMKKTYLNEQMVRHFIQRTNWQMILEEQDPNEIYQFIKKKFISIYAESTQIFKNRRNNIVNPWMTKSLKESCKERDLLWRR